MTYILIALAVLAALRGFQIGGATGFIYLLARSGKERYATKEN